MLGLPRCFTFGGLRIDAAVARELLRAIEPVAIEAAVEAEQRYMKARGEKQRIVQPQPLIGRRQALVGDLPVARCEPGSANRSRQTYKPTAPR